MSAHKYGFEKCLVAGCESRKRSMELCLYHYNKIKYTQITEKGRKYMLRNVVVEGEV